MRKILLLLLVIALVVSACGSDEDEQATPQPELPTVTLAPSGPAPESSPPPTGATSTTQAPNPAEPPPGTAAEPGLAPESSSAAITSPVVSVPSGLQENGRLVSYDVRGADLNDDGQAEQVILTTWQEIDGLSATLLVEIVDAAGKVIYSENSWQPLDHPSTANPTAMPLTIYDRIEAVDIVDLVGAGRPQIVIQRRAAGTGQILTVKILQVDGAIASPLLELEVYKGLMTLGDSGFSLSQPLYLYHEPNCCPCRREVTSYAWDGQQFAVIDRQRAAVDDSEASCPSYLTPAQWQSVQAAGQVPAPRRDAALVFDRSRNRLLLFGGRSGDMALNDMWAFDLTSRRWRVLDGDAPVRPPARFSMVAAVDELGERLLITTGQAAPGQFLNDVWAFDLKSDSWRPVSVAGEAPPARYGAAGGIFDYADALYLSHGFTTQGCFDDTWAFDLEREVWRNVTPAGKLPLKRYLHTAAMTGPDSLVLFGGCSSPIGPCPQGDTWRWDGAAGRWTQIGQRASPAPRQFAAMVPLKDREETLLFGGLGDGDVELGDVWMLDAVVDTWSPLEPVGTSPLARHGHNLVWVDNLDPGIPGTGYVVLFGGNAGGNDLNDLWMLLPGDS